MCTCTAAAPATLSNLVPTFLSGLVLLKISWVEKEQAQRMRRVFSIRKRVRAEYAQIFFPGSAAGIPGTLTNLGSAVGVPWSAPGFSERTTWTVQATESSSSEGRAQEDSTQRGGPRKAAEEAKPIGDGAVSNAFTQGVLLLQSRRSHGVPSGVLPNGYEGHLMVNGACPRGKVT